jgi:hypothetical protein
MSIRKLGVSMRLARVVVVLALFLGTQVISTYSQQVVATWTGGSDNWSNAADWSTNPVVPNNVGGTTYSVTIGTPNSDVVMEEGLLNLTIDNLSLGATDSWRTLATLSISFRVQAQTVVE